MIFIIWTNFNHEFCWLSLLSPAPLRDLTYPRKTRCKVLPQKDGQYLQIPKPSWSELTHHFGKTIRTHFTQLFKCPCSVSLTGLLFGLFCPPLLIAAVSVEVHPHPSSYLSFPSTLQAETWSQGCHRCHHRKKKLRPFFTADHLYRCLAETHQNDKSNVKGKQPTTWGCSPSDLGIFFDPATAVVVFYSQPLFSIFRE